MRDLGTLGGSSVFPKSINNRGHFVGFSAQSDYQGCAFLWTEENGMQDLETLGGSSSSAYDINEFDQVVGESYTSDGERHAFLWDEINGMQDLNDLIPDNSGWVLFWASGINNAGEIVGVGQRNGFAGDRAFLLMPAH